MTNEQLEALIDETHKDSHTQWASYSDMKDVTDDLMDAMMTECRNYCYDAVNLVFEMSSSTSGMYSTWYVSISPRCTVYLDRVQPRGNGGTLSAAFANFILKGRFKRNEYKPKLKKWCGMEVLHTAAGNPVN